MPSRSSIILIIPLLIVSCVKEELSEPSCCPHPPSNNTAVDANSSFLPTSDTSVKDYNPDTVCHELMKVNSPAWDPGQWALGIKSKNGGFYPILFFPRDIYAKSCQVWYPRLELRQWRKGLWIKS